MINCHMTVTVTQSCVTKKSIDVIRREYGQTSGRVRVRTEIGQ